MPSRRLPINSRKLLVAAIGVAAVSYVGCEVNNHPISGNLMSIDGGNPDNNGGFPTSGNLMAPTDAGVIDANDGAAVDDAADAGEAGDASDDAADADDAHD